MAPVLLILLLLWAPLLSARPKKDIIYFKNGDRWTCEIQKLDRLTLSVKLDYVDGTVSVDWTQVDRVESPQLFVVRNENGELVTGSLAPVPEKTEEPALAVAESGAQNETVPLSRVLEISQTETSFLQGIHGSLDSGFTYSKNDSQRQFTLNGDAEYRKRVWEAQANYQSSFNGSQTSPNNFREDLTITGLRYLGRTTNNYFAAAISEIEHNDEQQLGLRTILGGALGHVIKQTANTRVYWVAGGAWTRENFNTEPPTATFNSAEGLAGISMEYFRFKTTDLQFMANSFPSLTDPGRIRVNTNGSIKFELVKNLYLKLSAYLTYDNKPPQGAVKSDYGTSSSLGWTF